MGMIADDMAEVVKRTQNDATGALTDLRRAGIVELLGDATGKVWINVDGVCALRVQSVDQVNVDTSAVLVEHKTVSA